MSPLVREGLIGHHDFRPPYIVTKRIRDPGGQPVNSSAHPYQLPCLQGRFRAVLDLEAAGVCLCYVSKFRGGGLCVALVVGGFGTHSESGQESAWFVMLCQVVRDF